MALDLANGYSRKDSASASNVYYGYSPDPGATDGDKVFAIRKVSNVAGVETVTWTNGTPISYNDSWTSRTFSFSAPGGTLGPTCTLATFSNGFYVASFTWSSLQGVSKYLVTFTNSRGVLDEFGRVQTGIYSRSYTANVFNLTSWSQPSTVTGSHTFTVTATNVAGSTSSSISVNFV